MKINWRCSVCGLIDGGVEPPASCPECGARRAHFVASRERPRGVAHNPLLPRDRAARTAFGPSGSGCFSDD